jgi:hypothetical protein
LVSIISVPGTRNGAQQGQSHALVKAFPGAYKRGIRQRVRTARKTYGLEFAAGTRSDARPGTVLEKSGAETLDAYRKGHMGGD